MSTHRQIVAITYETAVRAVAIAMEEGERAGVKAVVSVADPSMTLIAYGMSDGATPHSAETSRRKAATSASTRRRTGQIPESLTIALPLGTGGALTTIDGGMPIFFDDAHVGGLGVAGGSPAQDAEIALETLKRLGAVVTGFEQ
ncbi:heme-binding protein [Microbacterium sp. SD291]|uniref:GlcG/HbpS family heme-binding protein n=1 Tax=Microbacterium sp. SD291 TaxID=2782007 RepID=UPI001A971315|nr:heme-binding protein [Microbacterium sp. SD291]MBO0980844.1 heme-binding protein [Microbacterium sp. SD291]